MATKRDDAPLPRLMQSRRWLLVIVVVLLAAFVALDQWRTAQPVLTQAMLPAGATTAAAAGRNTPQPRTRLGIIPGHNRVRKVGGEFERVLEPDPVTGMPPDPGATCKDGPSEADITWNVARRVADELKREGPMSAELLSEFDPLRARDKFFGLALISIHVDACLKDFSGFKVAHIAQSSVPQLEDALVNCLRDDYKAATNLQEHTNTITPDMQYYHAFNEITPTTPGAIIELGFMNDDKELLKQGDLPVKGLLDGIRCFAAKQGIIGDR
jgi:hypothetical protein